MPHYSFDLVVTLFKFGEQPIIMTKRTLDMYHSIIMSVVYQMCKSYIDKGWRISKVETVNFEFHQNIGESWNHPD
jgi:hypothetical protein